MTIEEEVAQLRREVQDLRDRREIFDCLVREARGRDRHDAERPPAATGTTARTSTAW